MVPFSRCQMKWVPMARVASQLARSMLRKASEARKACAAPKTYQRIAHCPAGEGHGPPPGGQQEDEVGPGMQRFVPEPGRAAFAVEIDEGHQGKAPGLEKGLGEIAACGTGDPGQEKSPRSGAPGASVSCGGDQTVFFLCLIGFQIRLLVRYSSTESRMRKVTATKPTCFRAINLGSAAHMRKAATSSASWCRSLE